MPKELFDYLNRAVCEERTVALANHMQNVSALLDADVNLAYAQATDANGTNTMTLERLRGVLVAKTMNTIRRLIACSLLLDMSSIVRESDMQDTVGEDELWQYFWPDAAGLHAADIEKQWMTYVSGTSIGPLRNAEEIVHTCYRLLEELLNGADQL